MPVAQTLLGEIDNYIGQSGAGYSRWYVGITSDINERLFGYHQVPHHHWWIYRRADNHHDARAIEAAFLEAGCRGGSGGGDYTAVYVYAYLVTAQTVE